MKHRYANSEFIAADMVSRDIHHPHVYSDDMFGVISSIFNNKSFATRQIAAYGIVGAIQGIIFAGFLNYKQFERTKFMELLLSHFRSIRGIRYFHIISTSISYYKRYAIIGSLIGMGYYVWLYQTWGLDAEHNEAPKFTTYVMGNTIFATALVSIASNPGLIIPSFLGSFGLSAGLYARRYSNFFPVN